MNNMNKVKEIAFSLNKIFKSDSITLQFENFYEHCIHFRLQNGNIYCDVSIRNEMIKTLSIKSLVEYISHNFVDLMLKEMYKEDK